jgi:hypothetical protein
VTGADSSGHVDPRRRFLLRSRWLDPAWYARRVGVPVGSADELVEHYLANGAPAGIAPNEAIAKLQDPPTPGAREKTPPTIPNEDDPQLLREIELVRTSGLFDAHFYTETHDGLVPEDVDPLLHFCRVGWRQVLRPRADFDPWWYWTNHLDAGREELNPFVHYVLIGRAAGYSGIATDVALTVTSTMPTERRVRRICLFAGYDAEGVLDDYVIDYIGELSRFADVYYLCDGYLDPTELAKLDGITMGAWAIRHGAYDFGSYSMLARDLVGWDQVQQYDELLLVNDSCYLLGGLADVFARMDSLDCAWWGLQATKGITFTQDRARAAFETPIPMQDVRGQLLQTFELDPLYDFLVGSYFLAYRTPVLNDSRFRHILDSVHKQRSKLQIVLRYEIGLTHFLIGRGYSFDTYIDALYPFHPIFSEWYFELLEAGFPLLKKYFIYQNHYDVPGMSEWKQLVRAHFPDAQVELFEQNLRRTAPADRLDRSLSIVRAEDGSVSVPTTLQRRELRLLDRSSPTFDHWWAFVVDPDRHTLCESSRAILEHVRHDPSIHKVVLTRSRRVAVTGENMTLAALDSREGQDLLVRSAQVIVSGRFRLALMRRLLEWDRHRLIAVRDGLSLQRDGTAIVPRPWQAERRPRRVLKAPRHPIHGLPAASDVDLAAALAEHYPATYRAAWRTGLPAHDFLTMPEEGLPTETRADLDRIRTRLDGRRLITFAPGFDRSTEKSAYRFDKAQLKRLSMWATERDVVLGLREHPSDSERAYRRQFGAEVLDLGTHRVTSTSAVLRASDALLTDVSGSALDFLLTGRPVLSFVHDRARVETNLTFDLDQVMPLPVAHDFDGLMIGLSNLVQEPTESGRQRYERIRNLLFDRLDDQNARRVVNRIRCGYVEETA